MVGDQLGLYGAIGESGPLTSQELARKTGTNERYIREWLAAQAGEKRIREVVEEGGFQQFRRVAETPFNLVYEARPQ